jgi:hypothetical protein
LVSLLIVCADAGTGMLSAFSSSTAPSSAANLFFIVFPPA